MIDYEKLEKARHLCSKLNSYYFTIDFCVEISDEYRINITLDSTGEYEQEFDSLDDLITKLEELVKPEPKYKKHQLVWFVDNHSKIESKVVMDSWEAKDIKTGKKEWSYDCSMGAPLFESQLFPTRQALIEHQLQYWQKLYNEALDDHGIYRPDIQLNESQDVDRCSHESDGNIYTSCPPQNKCIKCGEFYR